jgi:hypothetical protein
MKWDRLFHILKYVHFSINKTESDETDETCDSLWKNNSLSYMFNDKAKVKKQVKLSL